VSGTDVAWQVKLSGAVGTARNIDASLPMRVSKAVTSREIKDMRRGDAVDAIEAAKRIIGSGNRIVPAPLMEIALDRKLGEWSRIAAVYALGYARDPSGEVAAFLSKILKDRTETSKVRAHAAEAIGNLPAEDMEALLRQMSASTEPADVRRSCNYALSQLRRSGHH
jgi:hypothetical protein